MKNQIKLKESDLHKMIEGKVMQALNEIGDTPAGRFMIGRLSARKGQNGNMPSEFGKFANSDSFTDGRIFQKNLQQFAADTSKSDDPRKVTFGELPKDEDYGAESQSYYPLSRLLVGHLGGVPEDNLQMNKYRQRMRNQEKHPDKVSKGSMLKAEDPAIIPFDTTLRDYFGNDAKTNVASGLKEGVVGPGDPEYDEFIKKYHEWEAENKRLNDTFWNTLTPEDEAFLKKSQGTFSRQSAINALKKKKGLLSPPMPTYSKNERPLKESQFRKIVENKVRGMLKEMFDENAFTYDRGSYNAYMSDLNAEKAADAEENGSPYYIEPEKVKEALEIFGIVPVDVEGGRMWHQELFNGNYYWSALEALKDLDMDLSYVDEKYLSKYAFDNPEDNQI